jgi:hypothetical protein
VLYVVCSVGSAYARENRRSDQTSLVAHTEHMGDYCRGLTAHSTLRNVFCVCVVCVGVLRMSPMPATSPTQVCQQIQMYSIAIQTQYMYCTFEVRQSATRPVPSCEHVDLLCLSSPLSDAPAPVVPQAAARGASEREPLTSRVDLERNEEPQTRKPRGDTPPKTR